jgi:UPF0716 protein FxsA
VSGTGATGSSSPWGRRVRAFLALIALAEITVLILLSQVIGAAATVLAVLGFSVAGLWVLRHASRRLFGPAVTGQESPGTATGPLPPSGQQVAEAVPVLGAGILMTVPGILTGVLGTLLLFAPIRRLLRPLAVRIATPVVARLQRSATGHPVVPGEVLDPQTRPARDVEVEVIEITDADPGTEGTDPPRGR